MQIADKSLLAGPTATGSVVRIPAGGGSTHESLVSGLKSPYGIALGRGYAYVTTCAMCADEGEVLRVSLRSTS